MDKKGNLSPAMPASRPGGVLLLHVGNSSIRNGSGCFDAEYAGVEERLKISTLARNEPA